MVKDLQAEVHNEDGLVRPTNKYVLHVEVPEDWELEESELKGMFMDMYGTRHTNHENVVVKIAFSNKGDN